MRSLGDSEVVAALDFPSLIEALRQMFRAGGETPARHQYSIPVPGGDDASLLLMPAWQAGQHIGVKVLTIFPDNAAVQKPSLMGAYLLFDGKTGEPLMQMDAPALTARRTAAASALAASYLARPDCERLLMVGTGALASHLIEAHASVRPIVNVLVWGRDHDKAQRLAYRLTRRNRRVVATTNLADAVRGAHIVCCATPSAEPLMVMDGPGLTARRTAAASALAASYLARPDCERLLMVGTGALAKHLIEAHASVRPIVNVLVWGRDHEKAQKLAHRLTRRNLKVAATTDLANAVRGAHIVCCATASQAPLIQGHWLPLGVHLDLVGGFRPDMREVDDDCVRRARVFVDTRAGALEEAGDIIQPLQSGALREDDIAGDLFDLARGSRAGRRYHDQITLFKSVGTAIEDLAAARLALDNVRHSSGHSTI